MKKADEQHKILHILETLNSQVASWKNTLATRAITLPPPQLKKLPRLALSDAAPLKNASFGLGAVAEGTVM